MPRLGVISDTHGLLRPEAVRALVGADLIVHAGDVGGPEVLDGLRALAPVVAVRGNNDEDDWAAAMREREHIRLGGITLLVIHDLKELEPDAAAIAGVRVVISGHSHKPRVDERDGVLYVNPGSAGRRRFRLPITVGELRIDGAKVTARIHDLQI